MDKYKVKITSQAHAQMLEIFTYISEILKAHSAAMRLIDEIEKNILSLDTMPGRVALIDDEPWRSYGIHKMPIKNFIVYFWINEKLKEVHVTAVVYGRRDQLEQLRQMEIQNR